MAKQRWKLSEAYVGLKRFKLQSLAKVRGGFLLICIAHNLEKLAQYGHSLHPAQAAALKTVQWRKFSPPVKEC